MSQAASCTSDIHYHCLSPGQVASGLRVAPRKICNSITAFLNQFLFLCYSDSLHLPACWRTVSASSLAVKAGRSALEMAEVDILGASASLDIEKPEKQRPDLLGHLWRNGTRPRHSRHCEGV